MDGWMDGFGWVGGWVGGFVGGWLVGWVLDGFLYWPCKAKQRGDKDNCKAFLFEGVKWKTKLQSKGIESI